MHKPRPFMPQRAGPRIKSGVTACGGAATTQMRKDRRAPHGQPKWGASVARCSPYRWNPLLLPGAARTALLSDVTQSVRTLLRGNRERLVVVGDCCCERFYGAFRPGKNTVFQYTSILVRPHQNWPLRAV